MGILQICFMILSIQWKNVPDCHVQGDLFDFTVYIEITKKEKLSRLNPANEKSAKKDPMKSYV